MIRRNGIGRADVADENLGHILCVDDEAYVRTGLARVLESSYRVTTAASGVEALDCLRADADIAVVISDFSMPRMNGAEFLAHARELAPAAVRMMLTGHSDVGVATTAVNDGRIFQFLTKPCSPADLRRAVAAAFEQHRLMTAERVLLEQTLSGSIRALADVLALAQPTVFGRALRIQRHAVALAIRADVAEVWQVEIAAVLMFLGYVGLGDSVAERLLARPLLTHQDVHTADELPERAVQLIAHIPRLENVCRIIRYAAHPFGGSGSSAGPGGAPPLESRILRIAMDYDRLESERTPPGLAVDAMLARHGQYDPELLSHLREAVAPSLPPADVREMPLASVRVGMIFATDVLSPKGILLVARGQEVTDSILHRIRNGWVDFADTHGVRVIVGNTDAMRASTAATTGEVCV